MTVSWHRFICFNFLISSVLTLATCGSGTCSVGGMTASADKNVKRLGQLQIELTAVSEAPESEEPSLRNKFPPRGHYFFTVYLIARNVTKDPNCTWVSVRLLVDQGYEYFAELGYGDFKPPPLSLSDLLPDQADRGAYLFAPHEGAKPVAIVIVGKESSDEICPQIRDHVWPMFGEKAARISLDGFLKFLKPTTPSSIPASDIEYTRADQLIIVLTDRESWKTGGELATPTGTGASQLEPSLPLPKSEFTKAFQEKCSGIVITTQKSRADYVILLDHDDWGSPPYEVSVLNRGGAILYSRRTNLLGNAVKNACDALTHLSKR